MSKRKLDNYNIIEPILDFSDPEKFYFLQIIQRKKDHKDRKRVNGTNNNNRLVKPYYIGNKEYFEFIKPEVIELCKVFNARAYINLNRRSWRKAALQHLRKITDQIIQEDWTKAYKAFSGVCGSYADEKNKTWILDVDTPLTTSQVKEIGKFLKQLQPEGDKIKIIIPSPQGMHLISSPFNLQQAKEKLKPWGIEVHKNNPTNLYIP